MADRYWVGADDDWHNAFNWAATSGGAGGAGIPTSADDVFFDGNGYVLCQPVAPIECNDLTLLVGMIELLLPFQGGIIYGDFEIQDGYFGPVGGGGYTVEFKGNYLNTGGTVSVGTGPGVDPTCDFSGTSKTYVHDNASAASYQNFTVSGTYTFSGTRLSVAWISQELRISGEMEISYNNRVDLAGTFEELTGTLTGLTPVPLAQTPARFVYHFEEGDPVPTGGTIDINYFQFLLDANQIGEPIDEDLVVDGWSNVHNDWTHVGTEPWIHDDDGDTNYITLPAEVGEVGSYDEHYTIEDIDSDDWTSIALTKVKVHLKGRLYDGVSGHALFVSVRAYLWDGTTWQDGGTALFLTTSYEDRVCSTSLHTSFDTIPKVDGMLLKLEIDQVIDGGADKGGLNITQAWVEIEGTSYRNPINELPSRTWSSPCNVEVIYTADGQTFRLEGGARHYFMNQVNIHADDTGVSAMFDCSTYDAEMWVEGAFDMDNAAFPDGTFTMKFGDGTHVFRNKVDFFFSVSSATSHLVVDAGEGTLILYPKSTLVIIVP